MLSVGVQEKTASVLKTSWRFVQRVEKTTTDLGSKRIGRIPIKRAITNKDCIL